jgi:hypothetical protein
MKKKILAVMAALMLVGCSDAGTATGSGEKDISEEPITSIMVYAYTNDLDGTCYYDDQEETGADVSFDGVRLGMTLQELQQAWGGADTYQDRDTKGTAYTYISGDQKLKVEVMVDKEEKVYSITLVNHRIGSDEVSTVAEGQKDSMLGVAEDNYIDYNEVCSNIIIDGESYSMPFTYNDIKDDFNVTETKKSSTAGYYLAQLEDNDGKKLTVEIMNEAEVQKSTEGN